MGPAIKLHRGLRAGIFRTCPKNPVSHPNNPKKSLHQRKSSPIVSPRHGGVAQLGERLTGSQEVRGSIPLVSTIVNSKGHRISGGLFSCPSTPQTKMKRPRHKKLRNYLPGFVQSLLAKHNSLSNSRPQQYNSGGAHQPTHPHKPAAMYARRHNIPHNHGK